MFLNIFPFQALTVITKYIFKTVSLAAFICGRDTDRVKYVFDQKMRGILSFAVKLSNFFFGYVGTLGLDIS